MKVKTGARSGWVLEATILREMAEDVWFIVRTLTLYSEDALADGHNHWSVNAVRKRIALLPNVCQRVIERLENNGQRRLSRRRRRLRRDVLQLELPLGVDVTKHIVLKNMAPRDLSSQGLCNIQHYTK